MKKNIFTGKKVLITGGTGSLGIEIIKELLKFNPQVIRILDIDETRLFDLENKLKNYSNIRYFLGDVRDKERLKRAIEGIDIVFHLAALKHVVSCEYNPFEAVKTNVMGLQNLIEAAMTEKVEKFIFTSSDKAVNPTNVMGATKLLSERLVTSANYYKGNRRTVFSSVRFGNVLGSRGSIIPLLNSQIQSGGPVTITDKNMTRFVMSTSEAINLIFKATQLAVGGEIFVLKMPAVRILDLIQVVINEVATESSKSGEKIKIKVIGTKPGEKLYEELMTEDEAKRALEMHDMFILLPEIKELIGKNRYQYSEATPTVLKSYKSKDVTLLTKGQITDMLRKDKLI